MKKISLVDFFPVRFVCWIELLDRGPCTAPASIPLPICKSRPDDRFRISVRYQIEFLGPT
jgi:hypothetical protein